MQESKKPWLSKTLWANFLIAGSALAVPSVSQWMSNNPEAMASIMAGVNMLLRWVSKDKLELRA